MDKELAKYIRNMDILRYQKYLIKKEIEGIDNQIEIKVNALKNYINPDTIITDIFGTGTKAELMQDFLPLALKYRKAITHSELLSNLNKAQKGGIIGAIGILGSLLGYKAILNKIRKKRTEAENNRRKNN